MVIGQPRDLAFPVARFWFEEQRESVAWYVPWPLSLYLRRWRRIGPKEKLHLRDVTMAGAVIEFASEREMYQFQRQLEVAEDAWA